MSNNLKIEIFKSIYEENKQEHIEFLKKKMPNKDEKDLDSIYENTINKYVFHIENFLNENRIDSFSEDNIELKDLIPSRLCDDVFLKKLLDNKIFNGIVYIDILKSPAYFNIKNMTVEEGINLDTIPGLLDGLKNKSFNYFFNGRNIIEVKYVLEQMGVLSKNCELEKAVEEHFKNQSLRNKLIENMLCIMIINDIDEHTKDRTRIIREVSGIQIDIIKYMNSSTGKKLTFIKEDK